MVMNRGFKSPLLTNLISKLRNGKSLVEINKVEAHIDTIDINSENYNELIFLYLLMTTKNKRTYEHDLCLQFANKMSIKSRMPALMTELNDILKEMKLEQLEPNDILLDNFLFYLNPSNVEFAAV